MRGFHVGDVTLHRFLYLLEGAHLDLAHALTRHAELVGELVRYENSYWLCYVRGPAGIIVELAEKIG